MKLFSLTFIFNLHAVMLGFLLLFSVQEEIWL
jgi:hypothetical protein